MPAHERLREGQGPWRTSGGTPPDEGAVSVAAPAAVRCVPTVLRLRAGWATWANRRVP